MTTESCQNDGDVGPDCRCNCKEGFTGENCETFGKIKITVKQLHLTSVQNA